MLSLHNIITLKNWQCCFEFVSEKIIQQLFTIITDVEITNLNVSKSSKKEFQSLIEFYKLANSKHQISWQIQNHHFDESDNVLDVNIIHETILKYNQKCWIAHSILFEFNYHDVLIMCHKNKIDSWIQSWIVFYAYQWKIIIQKIQIDDEILLTQNFFDKIAEDEFDWLSTVSDSWKQHD